MNVVVIDLGVSNIPSLTSALTYVGAPHVVTRDPNLLESATHVVLPGVGAFDAAMRMIGSLSLTNHLRRYAIEQKRPLLGVCLGMQLLCEGSEEGSLPGLALVPGRVTRLSGSAAPRHKVPHVGFSAVYGYTDDGLFKGLGQQTYFYFTHSFALPSLKEAANIGLCDHASRFVGAFQKGNICGAQFHPEKSQSAGLRLISNFLEFASS